MTVGFIGLGKMGGPMAANVAAASPGLVCFDIAGTHDRMPTGAVAAASIADLAEADAHQAYRDASKRAATTKDK